MSFSPTSAYLASKKQRWQLKVFIQFRLKENKLIYNIDDGILHVKKELIKLFCTTILIGLHIFVFK